jgi:hypothetical protein
MNKIVAIDWGIKEDRTKIVNEKGELLKGKKFEDISDRTVLIEAGCPKLKLIDLCKRGCKVHVIAGEIIKDFRDEFGKPKLSKYDPKSHENDAKLILKYYKLNGLKEFREFKPLSDAEGETIREGRHWIRINKMEIALKNQFKADKREYGKGAYQSGVLLFIKDLEKEKNRIERKIKKLNPETFKRISEIPGVGDKTAARIIGENNPRNFNHLSEWLSYCGFTEKSYAKRCGKYNRRLKTIICYITKHSGIQYKTNKDLRTAYDLFRKEFESKGFDHVHQKAWNRISTFFAKEIYWKANNIPESERKGTNLKETIEKLEEKHGKIEM